MTKRNVARIVVPYRGCAGRGRLLDVAHRRQRLIVDFDQFGGAARLSLAVGDHEGDPVADRTRLVAGQQRTRCAIALRRTEILRHGRNQHAELVGGDVLGREHAEHAIGLGRLGSIDPLDARMAMRRHHHHAVGLLRQDDIVDITPAPGDEAMILDPPHRLTDTELASLYVHESPHLLNMFLNAARTAQSCRRFPDHI